MRHGRQIDKVTRVKERIITNNIDQVSVKSTLDSPPQLPIFLRKSFDSKLSLAYRTSHCQSQEGQQPLWEAPARTEG